jgi:hypothetical protein
MNDNSCLGLINDLQQFNFGVEPSDISLEVSIFNRNITCSFNLANRSKQLECFDLMLSILEKLPRKEINLLYIFQPNKGCFLDLPLHWTRTADFGEIRLWSGAHGHVTYDHVDSGGGGKLLLSFRVPRNTDGFISDHPFIISPNYETIRSNPFTN